MHELPHVAQGCLYRNDGSLLAEYRRRAHSDSPISNHCLLNGRLTTPQVHFEAAHLHVTASILQDSQSLGWIYLDSDLSPINARLRNQITFSSLTLLIAILFTGLLATWLQRLISGPIKAITEVARRIEEKGDHQLRAPVTSQDEVGQLALSFNAMLDALEAKNRQLRGAQQTVRKLSLAVEQSPNSIIITNPKGIIEYVNPAFSHITGYSGEEAIGAAPGLLKSGLTPTNTYIDLWRNIRGGRTWAGEFSNRKKNGDLYWDFATISPIKDHDGNITHFLSTQTDVSERKKMEEELHQHRDKLESLVEQRTAELKVANKELESFSYSVSHDLRAPLRSISGFSQIMLEDYNNVLDAEGQGLLTRVIDNTQRMSELIDDLLSLSRLGRKELHTTSVNFDQLVNEIMRTLQDNDTRLIEFSTTELGNVIADQNLLKVIMENLLGNAWKYTAKTDPARIEMGKQQQDGETVFFVKDNGAGFDMAYANKIFIAFQRLHKADEFEGTGIGLATVQRIIQRHGGRIWAEATVGEGACFYFTLGKNVQVGMSLSEPQYFTVRFNLCCWATLRSAPACALESNEEQVRRVGTHCCPRVDFHIMRGH